MTDKICKNCGTYMSNGHFCEECGTQLYPDIGFTEWQVSASLRGKARREHKEPKFNRWTGQPK